MKKFILCAIFAMFLAFAPATVSANNVEPIVETITLTENMTTTPERFAEDLVIYLGVYDVYVDGVYIGTYDVYLIL